MPDLARHKAVPAPTLEDGLMRAMPTRRILRAARASYTVRGVSRNSHLFPLVRRIPRHLTTAEKKVVAKAQAGEEANFGSPTPEQLMDPGSVAAMPVVSAAVIRALCLGEWENICVHAKRVEIAGARIMEQLDFDFADFRCPLGLFRCRLDHAVCLRNATAKAILFSGSYVARGIDAMGLTVTGDVFLRNGFMAKGAVRLPGASIGGALDMRKATFDNSSKTAISLESAVINILSLKETRITGFLILDHCRVRQLVDDLESWPAAGDLDLDGAFKTPHNSGGIIPVRSGYMPVKKALRPEVQLCIA